MDWIFFSILATICFIIYDLLSKKLATKSKNPQATALVYNSFLAIFSIIPFFIFRNDIFTQIPNITLILLTFFSMIFWGLFGKLEYIAKKETDLSTFLIIVRIAPIITMIFSSIFFSELITFYKIVAIILTIIASLLITPRLDFKNKAGIILSILTAMCIGIAWTFDKGISPAYSIYFYSFLVAISGVISNMVFPTIKFKDLKEELKINNFIPLGILALVNTAGYISQINGMLTGEASKVIIISTTAGILSIGLAIPIFKEFDNIWKKLIAIILIIIASLLLFI